MKTTNTIYEFFLSETPNTINIGLDEAANKAFGYLVECHEKGMYFSDIILNMPKELGYVLHPASFNMGWQMLVDYSPSDQQSECINLILEADDMKMYKKGSSTLEVYEDFAFKQAIFEKKHGLVYDYPIFPEKTIVKNTVTSPPVAENTVVTDPITPENTYITLPAKEPEPSTPNWYTTEFTFDNHNKQILLYTIYYSCFCGN